MVEGGERLLVAETDLRSWLSHLSASCSERNGFTTIGGKYQRFDLLIKLAGWEEWHVRIAETKPSMLGLLKSVGSHTPHREY